MLAFFRDNPRAFLAAVIVHLGLLAVLFVGMDWTQEASLKGEKKAPIQAVVIDADKLSAEINRQQEIKQQKQKQEQEKLKQLELKTEQARKAREQEEKQLADLKKKREETKKKAELEAKQRADAKLKLQQKAKQKAEAEKKRKADEQRKTEEKLKVEEQRVADEKRKAEEQRKAEEKRKADVVAKRKAAIEAERKAAEAALQNSLAAEQEEMALQGVNKEVNRYIAFIQDKVQRSWIRPPGSGAGLTCTVAVRLIPSGEVIDAKILRSSGNAAFDRSVEAAVFKASPLPVSKDPKVMSRFRSFNFIFKPS